MTDPPPAGRAEPLVVIVAVVLPMAAGGVADRLGPLVGGELGQIAQAVGWVVLLGYLIRRSGRSPAGFGLGRPDWLTDGCTALLLVAGLWWTGRWAADLWAWTGWPPGRFDPLPAPARPWHWGLMAVGLGATGFAEELLYRGYLQTRLRLLTGSGVAAWLTAACLFAAAHSYQGPYGVVSALAAGLVLGAGFAGTGRVWGVTGGHTGSNLLLVYEQAARG